jgi:hypothetical protein
MATLTIVKQTSGKVLIQGISRLEYQEPNRTVRKSSDNTKAEILDGSQVVTTITLTDVISTQVLPAAAIPAPATIEALVSLLASDFF